MAGVGRIAGIALASRRRPDHAIAGMVFAAIEHWLERQRAQLPLWLPVGMALGITLWFDLGPGASGPLLLIAAGIALAGATLGRGGRLGAVVLWAGVMIALGVAAATWRNERVAGPVLARAWTGDLTGRVLDVERIDARDVVRVTLAPDAGIDLPPRVRVNLPLATAPNDIRPGDALGVRARLMPPAEPAVPGAYDFARRAWFDGLGATGRAIGPVRIAKRVDRPPFVALRSRLAAHVAARAGPDAAGIAATLVTGLRGYVTPADDAAMRTAGFAHLLAISGLHVSAVTGGAYLLAIRLLALFPWLALRLRLPLVAATIAALAAIGYTLLAGAGVPTVRSCIAALLVIGAMVAGREPLSLRLVAAGAMVIMAIWPDTLAGPSFQMSFAAVVTVVALHQTAWMRRLTQRREESALAGALRGLAGLLVTGLVIELVLMPIALYHFHRAGVYGSIANLVAIPLTTFVIMPVEALALALDPFGIARPAWWLCALAIRLLLAIAHAVTALPGSNALLPAQAPLAFALLIGGGLWLALIAGRERSLGLIPALVGTVIMVLSPRPDLLITGDGRHVMLLADDGRLAMLRRRSGDYIRGVLAEDMGLEAAARSVDAIPGAQCGPDICRMILRRGDASLVVLATRSPYAVPYQPLIAACADADVVVSERRLPRACRPRWLRADRSLLARTGGLAIFIPAHRIVRVVDRAAMTPWWQARHDRASPDHLWPPRNGVGDAGPGQPRPHVPGDPWPDQL